MRAQLSIANGVREFAAATPSAIAVVDGNLHLSYSALHERSSRLANVLLKAGLTPGDSVAVLLGNQLEYPEVACGIAKAGLVMVPLNPRLTQAEIAFILGHSGARTLIVDEALAELTPEDLNLVLRVNDSYEKALGCAPARDPEIRVDENSPFCVAYTSGTTGEPKGVLISHRSRVLTFYCSALDWKLGAGRRSIAVAPMYHGAGFAFAYGAIHTGGTVAMLRSWDPERLLSMVAEYRAQSVFLVPTHAQTLRALGDQALGRHDLSSLDTLFFNAAALPVPLKKWVFDALTGADVHELYGSTEAGIVTNLRPADARRKAGSVGHPWFMTEVKLLDDDGSPVPAGTPGELFSRSPFLMNGYLHNDAATRACMTDDGFLTSGDIAVADEEGFLSIVDRKKDMIITGGLNVYPREIESVIDGCPGVRESAVVGEPDETWGERIVAYVAGSAAPADIEAHLRPHLAGYKLPKVIHIIPRLPRNTAGKVLKRELKESHASPR
ncbi:class I adenylate-forming enzyme family protein [Streptosporangium roseum]|uniref:class I adenylate-forming enzyme family protein n=1 Tax=Streptosporangium roseum TaxID=2001 RepID=UPI0004CCA8A4|nr:AMP-binding protein [Streptosporangium roseum]